MPLLRVGLFITFTHDLLIYNTVIVNLNPRLESGSISTYRGNSGYAAHRHHDGSTHRTMPPEGNDQVWAGIH
jgi:hypothetical protein